MIDPSTHWRDSGRRPKFFVVDATFIFPFLIFFAHISYKTLYFLIASFIFFLILDRTHFTVRKTIRYIRVFIGGRQRFRKGWWQ